MNTDDEISPNHDQTNQPLADASSTDNVEPQSKKVKKGIGGCLLYPLIFLIAQPLLFVYMLLTSNNNSSPMTTSHIFWPYTIYDLVLVGAAVMLLLLFARKKAILPAMFVLFLVIFAILSGLLANIFWRLPEARVAGRDPELSHMAMLFNCLLLIPYFVLDGRVNNTFIQELDDHSLADQLAKPFAAPARGLYNWLVRGGKKVFLFTVAFVILVFLFGMVVDSIVLNFFLS